MATRKGCWTTAELADHRWGSRCSPSAALPRHPTRRALPQHQASNTTVAKLLLRMLRMALFRPALDALLRIDGRRGRLGVGRLGRVRRHGGRRRGVAMSFALGLARRALFARPCALAARRAAVSPAGMSSSGTKVGSSRSRPGAGGVMPRGVRMLGMAGLPGFRCWACSRPGPRAPPAAAPARTRARPATASGWRGRRSRAHKARARPDAWAWCGSWLRTGSWTRVRPRPPPSRPGRGLAGEPSSVGGEKPSARLSCAGSAARRLASISWWFMACADGDPRRVSATTETGTNPCSRARLVASVLFVGRRWASRRITVLGSCVKGSRGRPIRACKPGMGAVHVGTNHRQRHFVRRLALARCRGRRCAGAGSRRRHGRPLPAGPPPSRTPRGCSARRSCCCCRCRPDGRPSNGRARAGPFLVLMLCTVGKHHGIRCRTARNAPAGTPPDVQLYTPGPSNLIRT